MDFNMVFCNGTDGKTECTEKARCARYWSGMTEKEAEKLGITRAPLMELTASGKCRRFSKG